MKAVIQRVKEATVTVENCVISEIGKGMLALVGIDKDDLKEDADFLVTKIKDLRIFNDAQGKMNLSLGDIKGEILLVSQFTLLGNCRKGKRPSFAKAAKPTEAKVLYEYLITKLQEFGISIKTGKFGATMEVNLINDGPVTIILDTKKSN